MWPTGFCILACLWVCACDAPDNDTIVLEPAGHSLTWLETDDEAPICRILGALGHGRRGIVVDITRTAGTAEATWVVSAPDLEADYSCAADVDTVDQTPTTTLDGCRATRGEQDVCLVELDVLLDEVDARYEALPAGERGALVLRLHPGDLSDERQREMIDALVARLLVFEHLEQIYLASWRPELLEALIEARDAALLFEVRTALLIRDRAGAAGGANDAVEIDAAWEIGADLVFVPARGVDDLIDDASRMALESGGVAIAAYGADDPTTYRRIVQQPGLDLVVGALGDTLAEDWGIDEAPAFDCRGFLQSRATLASFLPAQGQTNACPVF